MEGRGGGVEGRVGGVEGREGRVEGRAGFPIKSNKCSKQNVRT